MDTKIRKPRFHRNPVDGKKPVLAQTALSDQGGPTYSSEILKALDRILGPR